MGKPGGLAVPERYSWGVSTEMDIDVKYGQAEAKASAARLSSNDCGESPATRAEAKKRRKLPTVSTH